MLEFIFMVVLYGILAIMALALLVFFLKILIVILAASPFFIAVLLALFLFGLPFYLAFSLSGWLILSAALLWPLAGKVVVLIEKWNLEKGLDIMDD